MIDSHRDRDKYPYKDESPPSSSMNEREYREIEKKPCNALHTLHTLHERNDQIQVRMRKSIHKTFMRYCALAGITAGTFYEQAGILFMDLNPVDGTLLVINEVIRSNIDINERVFILVCTKELEEIIEGMKRYPDGKIHKNVFKSLNKTLMQCTRVKNKTPELEALMNEAMSYVE